MAANANQNVEEEEEDDALAEGTKLKDRYIVGKRLGMGAFGDVFHGTDVKTGVKVAIKSEKSSAEMPLLRMEVLVMRALKEKPQVPEFLACGRIQDANYVVMTLLGKSLLQLKKGTLHDRFTVQTSVRLGIQMITALEIVHNQSYLHRDVKPGNFAMGLAGTPQARVVHVLDFGLCRMYRNDEGKIRTPRIKCGFRGTIRYASISTHENKEMARHDDLWSLFYILVEMMSGQLPWRRVSDRKKVGRMKATMKPEQLLLGLPSEMFALLEELKPLQYYDDPNYDLMREILEKIIVRLNVKDEHPYDWETEEEGVPESERVQCEGTNLPVLATRNNEDINMDQKDRTMNLIPENYGSGKKKRKESAQTTESRNSAGLDKKFGLLSGKLKQTSEQLAESLRAQMAVREKVEPSSTIRIQYSKQNPHS